MAKTGLILVGVVPALCVCVLVVVMRRQRPGAIHPQCGRCGYPVAGLPTFICPECGSDLREWGIRTQAMVAPRDWGWFGLLARAVLWTLAVCIAGTMVIEEVERAVRRDVYKMSGSYEYYDHSRLHEIVVTREWMTTSRGFEDRGLAMTISVPSRETIRIERVPGEEELVTRVAGKTFTRDVNTLTGEDVIMWYGALGERLANKADREFARRLSGVIQMKVHHPQWEGLGEALSSRVRGGSTGSSSYSVVLNHGPILAAYTAGAIIWLAGLGLILRGRRKAPGA